MHVLIAEDDSALSLFLQRALETDGSSVRTVSDGAEAVEAFRAESPDLTILDLNMPKKDGESALVEMRHLDADRPILILTGRADMQSRVRCLDRGADDLILKPFSLLELQARCRTLLRRRTPANVLLRVDDLEVDRLSHSVRRFGQNINLTNKEFALLEHLLLHRGSCVSRAELLQTVWRSEPAQSTNIVDVYVNYLRRKLDDRPPGSIVRTLHGRGYTIPQESRRESGLQAAD